MELTFNSGFIWISVFFLLLALWAYSYYRKAESTNKWNKTIGKITASYINTISDDSQGFDMYEPYIKYKYSVDNRNYSNSNLSFAQEAIHSESKIKRLLSRYAPGNKAIIYYNPEDHSESVLFKGARPYNYIYIFMSLIFALTFFVFAFSEMATEHHHNKKYKNKVSTHMSHNKTHTMQEKEQLPLRSDVHYYNNANRLIQDNKHELAIQELNNAIHDNPNEIKYYLLMDYLLARDKKWDQIISIWNNFILLNPNSSRAYRELSGTYFHKGDMESALKNVKIAADMGDNKAKQIYDKYK